MYLYNAILFSSRNSAICGNIEYADILSEVSQTEKDPHYMIYLKCGIFNFQTPSNRDWNCGCQGLEVGENEDKLIKGINFHLWVNFLDWMYNIESIVNNTVLCVWMLLKVELKYCYHKKEMVIMWDKSANEPYCSNHFAIYTCIKSSHCTTLINAIL